MNVMFLNAYHNVLKVTYVLSVTDRRTDGQTDRQTDTICPLWRYPTIVYGYQYWATRGGNRTLHHHVVVVVWMLLALLGVAGKMKEMCVCVRAAASLFSKLKGWILP